MLRHVPTLFLLTLIAVGPSSAAPIALQPGATLLPPTDAFTTRFHNPDNSYTALLSARPVRHLVGGVWQDLNGRLAASDTQGFAAQTTGFATARLSASGAGGWNSVSLNGRSVRFALAGGSSAPGALQPDGQSMAWSDALPGIDLSLTGRHDGGLKENILIKQRAAAPWNSEFHFSLALSGLDATPVTDDQGSRVLLSESGTGVSSPVMQIAPPFAVDAKGRRTTNCWYNLADDRTSVDLVVDPNFLASASYPVLVDPTITLQPAQGSGSMGCYVDSTGYSTNYGTNPSLYVGDISGVTSLACTFLRFNLAAVPPGSTITQASLGLTALGGSTTQVDVYNNIQAWDQATLTKSNSGSNLSSPTYVTTQSIDPANSTTWTIDLTGTVQSWFNGTVRNYGLNLEPHGTGTGIQFASNQNATSADWPTLAVTYTAGSDPATASNAGAPRGWEAAQGLNPFQAASLERGNVLTTLPITGWHGFGPSVSLSLIHNSQETANAAGIAPKWQWNYSTRLDLSGAPGTIVRIGPDGRRDTYTGPGPTWSSPTGVFDVLTQSSSGQPYVLTHPNQVQDNYDATTGRLASIVDSSLTAGNEVDLGYDGSGHLITLTDANPVSGNRRSLSIHYTSGVADTITDALGRKWYLVYDGTTGDLIRVRPPQQVTSTPGTNAENCIVMTYNSMHDVTGIGQPDNNPSLVGGSPNTNWVYNYNTEYDQYGRGTACTGRSGLTYRGMHGLYLSYNASSSPTGVVIDDQTFVHHKYVFSSGVLSSELSVTNPTASEASWTGPTTVYNHDSQRNLTGVRLPGNPSSITGMNPYWAVVTSYDTSNSSQGSRGNPLSSVRHVLDSNSATSEDTDLERTTSYTYDSGGHNRVTQVTSTAYTGANHVTQYVYDGSTSGWRKLTSEKRYNDNDTTNTWTQSYSYYADSSYPGKVQTRTDGNGNQWGYGFDGYGNLTSETSPGSTSRTTSFTFDSTAHILPVTKTDNKGQVFTTSYHSSGTDANGLSNPDWRATQTSVNTSGTPTNYVHWTANGQPTLTDNFISGDPANTAGNEMDHGYVDGGLLVTESQAYGSAGYNASHGYTYDAMGRRTKLSYGASVYSNGSNGARTVTYTYDGLGKLASRTWASGGYLSSEQTTFTYDEGNGNSSTGLMTQQTNPNSTRTLYTFNGMGEETKREHDDLVSGVWTDMGTFNTTRSADGLVNTIQEPVNGSSSGYKRHLYYNAIGAMQEEDLYNASGSTLSKKQLYSFDKAGNRTERDQYDGSGSFQQGEINAYDAGNELTQIKHYGAGDVLSNTDNFAAGTDFDGNGNELASSGGKAFSMSYHADNLLKQVSGSGFTSETSYYYPGARISTRGGSYMQYDGNIRLQDLSSTPAPGVTLTWTATTMEMVDDLMVTYAYANGGSSPTSVTLNWMAMDPQGNVAAITNSSGTVAHTCASDLCGTNPTTDGSASTSSMPGEYQWECAYGYSYRTNSSGNGPNVYQIGARAYDPAQGRWLQQDPLSEGQGDWSYGANSPANAVDPTGLAFGLDDAFVQACLVGAVVNVGRQALSDQWNMPDPYAGNYYDWWSVVDRYVGAAFAGCIGGATGLAVKLGLGAAAVADWLANGAGLVFGWLGTVGYQAAENYLVNGANGVINAVNDWLNSYLY